MSAPAQVVTGELAAVRGELTRVDGKCGTLAALAGAAAAYAAGQASHGPAVVRFAVALAGVIFGAAVLVLLLTVVRPRLGPGGFCCWDTLNATEIQSRVRETLAQGQADADATELLHVLSVIAVTKYRRLRLAADLAAAGVVVLAAAGIAGAVAP